MKQYSNLFFFIIILILALFMIINPDETVNAASDGIKLWSLVVVPALLPFFIVAELLFSLGFVYFLGVLLEPVMQPLFRLPGCSSLVIAMGFTSGFPVGALLSRKLYDDKLLTAQETERLVSFTNNSSPLFILGAVGVGMFGSREVGFVLAASHYLANLMVGLLWRFKANVKLKSRLQVKNNWHSARSLLMEKFSDLDIGSVLSTSIKNSINNILAIGGFILIFSVITRMLTLWGFMRILAQLLLPFMSFLDISLQGAYGSAMGIFEMTIGTRAIALSDTPNLAGQLAAISMVLAFSGLSVIAQIMSIFAGTPIRMSFYVLSRFMQMTFSCIFTLIFYKYWLAEKIALPALSIEPYRLLYAFDAWTITCYSLLIGAMFIILLFCWAIFMSSD
ncbi:MAG: sporulation integral membrane protein YlbJ [Syntrophomonadaceae bacterium]|nr:sporulation integral membrane protein YlbJ [Syntrophomonadaceae bacterium]